MRYTVHNVPADVDAALRKRAAASGRSLNAVVLDVLAEAAGVSAPSHLRRDLSDIVGSWVEDPDVDAALADQRAMDRAAGR